MEYKFLAALLGLLLLACSSIHAAYANTEESNIHAEKTLPLEYPAVFGVDELLRQPSRDQHNEMVSRKLLRGAVKRGLTQSEKEEYSRLQAKRSESNDGEHVLDRDLESKKIAGIANAHHELLSGTPASSIRTPISAIQVVNSGSGEHQSKLQIMEKEGRVTSLQSLLSSFYHNLHKRISLLEVSKKQIISDTMDNVTGLDSNKHIPTTPVSLQVSQPFSDPYATSESPIPDNTTDITGMDYTPAQKKPPIHNKMAP